MHPAAQKYQADQKQTILFPLEATGAADIVCAIGNDFRTRSLPAPLVKKVLKRFQEVLLASAGSSTFTIEMAP